MSGCGFSVVGPIVVTFPSSTSIRATCATEVFWMNWWTSTFVPSGENDGSCHR